MRFASDSKMARPLTAPIVILARLALALSVCLSSTVALAGELVVLQNDHYRIVLDRAGGGLLAMEHRGVDAMLMESDTPRPYMFAMVGRRGVVPMEYAQGDMTLVEVTADAQRAVFRYRLPKEAVTIDVEWIGDGSPWLTLRSRVRNDSDLHVMSVTLPVLDGLAFGDPAVDVLAMPAHGGRFVENPAAFGQYERTYLGSASMCWMSLYNKNGGGLYVGGVNRPVLVTDLVSDTSPAGGCRLTLRRHLSLPPGEEAEFEFTIGLHDGIWHRAADRYRADFRAAWRDHPYGELPEWMRISDGYAGSRDIDVIKWIGVRHSQNWGHAGGGACPTYYLPHDRGLNGPRTDWTMRQYLDYQDTFRQINQRVRDGGGHVGYYLHGESLSPFYSFSETVYGLPRGEFPDDVRPPDGEWFFRNRLHIHPYEAPNAEPNWEQLWDPPQRRGESYPVMSFSPEWKEYMHFWTVDKYVNEYACDVMYYDTIAARPPFIDYNPHWNFYHNAEWSERIMAMFHDIREAAVRAGTVDNLGLIVEGSGDVYGLLSGHMISNFDRAQSIYRYTLPEQVVYSGLSNGGWGRPEECLRRAFIHGSRFDLLKPGFFFKQVVSLRRATRAFTYHPWADYRDNDGLIVSLDGVADTRLEGTGGVAPGAEEGAGAAATQEEPARPVSARWFRVDDGATRAAMLVFDNPDGTDGAEAQLALGDWAFTPRAAFAFTLDGEVVPWEAEVRDGVLVTKVPLAMLSAVIVVEEVSGERAVNVWLDEDYGRPDPAPRATLTNLTGRRLNVTLTLGSEADGLAADFPEPVLVTLQPYAIRRVTFEGYRPAPLPATVTLRADFAGQSSEHWLGLMPLVHDGGIEGREPVAEALGGASSIMVRGPGAGETGRSHSNRVLYLKPGFTYRVSAMVKREGNFRTSNFTLFNARARHASITALGSFASSREPHDWKRFETVVTMPDDLNQAVIYFYLHDGDGVMTIDDLRAEPVLPPNPADTGYRGIWYSINPTELGPKYSGGLGTYPANMAPMAVYAPEVNKTFFVWGGTKPGERNLRIMASWYDHERHVVPRPVIVRDSDGFHDAHANPSIALDAQGHIHVFSATRHQFEGRHYRSLKPYDIGAFEVLASRYMAYPQPWLMDDGSLFLLYARYRHRERRLFWRTLGADGQSPGEHMLAAFDGHYQNSWSDGRRVVTAFNYHPESNVDRRTNLYVARTDDHGKSWAAMTGEALETPLTDRVNPALVRNYEDENLLVYIHDLALDEHGNPAVLYLTSKHFAPGPEGDPRQWMVAHFNGKSWDFRTITQSTHNYDVGCLHIEPGGTWRVVGPTEPGPQRIHTGGEMAMWVSRDRGQTWEKSADLTRGSQWNHTYARRPRNAHPGFYAFWADGHTTRPSDSRLYFATRDGKTYRLPHEMDGDEAEPEPWPQDDEG